MFIPRHPVVENQFCQFAETTISGGVGGVLAYAGSVCYLVTAASRQEAIVNIYGTSAPGGGGSTERTPFGFLMQKVKTGYHQVHPSGYYMPGDLGSSDVLAQPKFNANGQITGTKTAPVGVAHLGIWDTVHYTVDTPGTTIMAPGDNLMVAASGDSKVTNGTALVNVTAIIARVVKGANAAQCQANVNNTTLYPIRIKLLI